MPHVAVSCEPPRFAGRGAEVHRALMGALRKLKVKNASLEVFLISDGAMRRVNARTRGLRRPATVLSFEAKTDFPRPEAPSRGRSLGEIYLAPDHIRARGESLPTLAIHGLLHLLGYTHKGRRDTIKMERMERKFLKSVIGK